MKHAGGCSVAALFCFFTVIFFFSPFAAITAVHVSGIVVIYFLRASTLMLFQVFCNSSQRLFNGYVHFILQLNQIGVKIIMTMKRFDFGGILTAGLCLEVNFDCTVFAVYVNVMNVADVV